MFTPETIAKFYQIKTPFYYYDIAWLGCNVEALQSASADSGFLIYYSLKANANDRILKYISSKGLGADCVSGNEIIKAIACGFKPENIVFAGVGKTDDEINLALDTDIKCFNCESLEEIAVINDLALQKNKIAPIALRINPDINANTHQHITTGISTSKFGISIEDVRYFVENLHTYQNIKLNGIHVHLGSNITDMYVFVKLAEFINKQNQWFYEKGIILEFFNVGGGLGIDYFDKNEKTADFVSYFNVFKTYLKLQPQQNVLFELGRSIVAQSGKLITKVLYTKSNQENNFVIVDAGMTDLMRPALYQAYHCIENITSKEQEKTLYNIAGPICESTDVFAKTISLPLTKRGDLLAIHTVGAYGQSMASQYNMRNIANACFSDEI